MIFSGFGLQYWSIWLSGGCLGLPWGTLGSPGVPGCPQQGFKERKLGSLDPPWPPKMKSFWYQFSMIFVTKDTLIFDWNLISILRPKWYQNESKNHHFFDWKTSLIFECFFIDFLDGFWEPKSLKMSTSCRRDAHFHKIAFFDAGTILEPKMM